MPLPMTRLSTYRMTSRCRHGLALAEVLVLAILLAGVLLLCIPYLLRQREAARRARCEFNLQRLAEAALAYEGLQGSFPG